MPDTTDELEPADLPVTDAPDAADAPGEPSESVLGEPGPETGPDDRSAADEPVVYLPARAGDACAGPRRWSRRRWWCC